MVKNIEIDGKQMTAIILDDSFIQDTEEYRKSLLNVLDCAVLNTDALTNGFPSGGDISNCLSLARSMETERRLH